MDFKDLKIAAFLATLAVAVFLSVRNTPLDVTQEIPTVLESLRITEKQFHLQTAPRVALGFAGCIDIFVDAVAFMEAAKIQAPPSSKHHPSTSSQKDLAENFAYFFTESAAATRHMSNLALYKELITIAENVEGARLALGCVAPIIGNLMAKEGAEVVIGAQIDSKYKKFLHPKVSLQGVEGVDENDIHIIMEYKTGDRWGKYKAIRANRYVIQSDWFNPNIYGLEPLQKVYEEFKPNLLVLGDFQAMDHFPFEEGVRKRRLQSVEQFLHETSEHGVLKHLEFGSFVDKSLLLDLKLHILPHINSIGMNEQELPNLLSIIQHGNVTNSAEAYPRTAKILDQIRLVYNLSSLAHGRLSRIHVHTLAFQAILTKEQSPWKNSKQAAAHASLTGSRYISGKDSLDVKTSKLLMDESFSTSLDSKLAQRIVFDISNPVSCWKEQLGDDVVKICVAPNMVCTAVKQTCGAGDHISAAGLMNQI